METIKITSKGKEVSVVLDDADYRWVKHLPLGIHKGYAVVPGARWIDESGKRRRKAPTSLHRIIMGVSNPREHVDHIDGNRLNNRRDNLRVVTARENNQNRKGANRNNRSCGYRGVTWDKNKKKWVAQVVHRKRRYCGGMFDTAEEANQAAIQLRDKLGFLKGAEL